MWKLMQNCPESLAVTFQGRTMITALCWALFTSNTAVTDLPVAC